MKDLVLIGASGICHEIIDTVFDLKKNGVNWNIVGIIDDDQNKWGTSFYQDIPIIGGKEEIRNYDLSATEFMLTFSSPSSYLKRETYVKNLLKTYPAIRFASIIHSTAYISPSARTGIGTFIGLGSVIDAKAVVGDHCLILFNSVISRHVEIGDFTFISASVNITGNKVIGKTVYLGVKSTINANVNDNTLVSAGSLVMKDVQRNSIVFNKSRQEVISFDEAEALQLALEHL